MIKRREMQMQAARQIADKAHTLQVEEYDGRILWLIDGGFPDGVQEVELGWADGNEYARQEGVKLLAQPATPAEAKEAMVNRMEALLEENNDAELTVKFSWWRSNGDGKWVSKGLLRGGELDLYYGENPHGDILSKIEKMSLPELTQFKEDMDGARKQVEEFLLSEQVDGS